MGAAQQDNSAAHFFPMSPQLRLLLGPIIKRNCRCDQINLRPRPVVSLFYHIAYVQRAICPILMVFSRPLPLGRRFAVCSSWLLSVRLSSSSLPLALSNAVHWQRDRKFLFRCRRIHTNADGGGRFRHRWRSMNARL